MECVREALWGKPDAFSQNSIFYQAIRDLALVRDTQTALRYGRCYFRTISGDGVHFGISTSAPGIISYSRILSDQEILIVANTNSEANWAGAVTVDEGINPIGKRFRVLYSNHAQFEEPGPVLERPAGSVQVTDQAKVTVTGVSACDSSLSLHAWAGGTVVPAALQSQAKAEAEPGAFKCALLLGGLSGSPGAG